MILPMKKVCLVVQDKYQNIALTKLRDLGIMHIETSKASSEKLSKVLEHRVKTENAINIIQPFKTPKKKKDPHAMQGGRERRQDTGPRRGRRAYDKMGLEEIEPYNVEAFTAPERPNLTHLMIGMGDERKTLEEQVAYLTRERGRIEKWGEFNPHDIKELTAKGIIVYLYEFSHEIFKTIPPKTRYIKVSEDKNNVRLMVLFDEIPGIIPFALPEKSIAQIDAELHVLKGKIDTVNHKIKSFADRRPILEKEMEEVLTEINFETARAKLEQAENIPGEYSFSHITGFVPAEDMDKLKAAAAANNWALTAVDPAPDEDVPTKLKNNGFVRMLDPITGFMDLIPGYREIDISLWFLIFFSIFFGMIFGDAAYGLLLLGLGIFGIIKTSRNGVPIALKTLCLLGFTNTLWGLLTCTWFGIPSEHLPQFLVNISLSYISPAKTDQAIVDQNLKLVCFSLALMQLSIAHITGIFRSLKRKSLRVFADVGALSMLWGMYNVVLALVVSDSNRSFPILPVSMFLLGGGFCLNFIFGYYEGNIVQSIMSSLKNIISVILGVTNVFSDVMSYIRLWAVGLAGASIAATVNNMAGPMLGNFMIFAGIILLVFGHGLNMVLNVLSVLVHGVRLNTREFSDHIGLTWSGIAYKPFSMTVKK